MQVERPAARVNAIATAVPGTDVQTTYREWARRQISGTRQKTLFDRMCDRAGIEHRWSVLPAKDARLDPGSFYARDEPPGTDERMRLYAQEAPDLALRAVANLPNLTPITHLVVASCTGFVAPGIDQIIARRLGLAEDVERVLVGFMGCYAGAVALRTARHIVLSDPQARVLVITVELSSLHLQPETQIGPLLAMLQFGDGAAAALVSSDGEGLALGKGLSLAVEGSDDLITWTIGDTGFAMHLSGEVPARLAKALTDRSIIEKVTGGAPVETFDAWAIHAGGRSILDAVEQAMELPGSALDASRAVLRDFGNMSSATLLFALEKIMRQRPDKGIALAFGPGLALEGLRFGWIDHAG